MLATGIKSPIGIKVSGSNLDEIDQTAREIETVAKTVPGATLIEYDGSAHGLFATDKERLIDDLVTFLGGKVPVSGNAAYERTAEQMIEQDSRSAIPLGQPI